MARRFSRPVRRWQELLAAAAMAGLLSACSLPNSGSGKPLLSNLGPITRASLQHGDDLMFGNRYGDAAREYQQVLRARPRDGQAHAHFALFLDYLHSGSAALVEARRAAALAPRDGYTLLVLTRTLDWGNHFREAAQAGAQAVRADPSSALAHAMYGEALADLGRFDDARSELTRAESLAAKRGRSAYEKAEVARNWANFYRQQGDRDAEAQQLERALAGQPRWIERSLELARFYLSRNDLPRTIDYLQRGVALQPRDVRLREEVGEIALFAQDYATAKGGLEAAVRLPGHQGVDIRLLGHIAVAADRDYDRAQHYFDEALDLNPSDGEAAAYLVGLYRYLLHDEAAARSVARGEIPGPQQPRRVSPEYPDVDQTALERQAEALVAVNRYRVLAGLAPVRVDVRLQNSARAHAYYFLFNHASPTVRGLGVHREFDGGPAFTGETVRERALYFGLGGQLLAEDIAHRGRPGDAVTDWVDSVFHRFPILRRDLQSLGYGVAAVGPLPIDVMDFAYGASVTPGRQMVAYPAPGQVNVPTVFGGNEVPEPLPEAAYPVGYPVTLTFDRGAHVEIRSYRLRDVLGPDLELHMLPPSDPNMENSIALLARKPLQPGRVYAAEVTGTIDGVAFEKQWQFATVPPAR